MDDRRTDRPSGASAIPLAVWLLLAGAVAHLAVSIVPDWYSLFGPYLLVDSSMVIGWIRAVSPFLLGAAVILGADRWPAGRRSLLRGAAALGAVGLLALGLDVWVALWELSPGVVSDEAQLLLIGRVIVAGLVFVAAYALLAAGLWAAAVPRARAWRRSLMWLIGLAGILAFGADLWAMVPWLQISATPLMMSLYLASGLLTALSAPAMAALAIAAVGSQPQRGGLPEALIAIGAVAAMGGITWEFVLPSAVGGLDFSREMPDWFFTVPAVAIVLGMLAMMAGFGAAALASRRVPDDLTV